MSRDQFHVATSCLPTVGFLGRDTKNPCRDLPHCLPCRDLKSAQPHLYYVAMPFFHVATSLAATHVATSKLMSRPQAAPQSFQPCHNLKIPGCNPLKTNPGRDLKSMSRPQTIHPKSQRGFSCHDQGLLTPNLSQVATPKRMSRHQPPPV